MEHNTDSLLQRGPNLMVSISGIRGRIPEGLDPVNIVAFARAFASVTGRRIVIGNDARSTGPILRHLLIGTLIGAGKEVIDIGLAPTPTVKAAVNTWKGHGGVMISASHNPPEWNAFKFIGKGGFFFNTKESERLVHAVRAEDYPAVTYKHVGSLREDDGVGLHIKSVLAVIPNVKEIRKRKYRVVVDAVSGAGRTALPRLLEELGCRVTRLYCDPPKLGEFPRPPEPTPTALKQFSAKVRATKAAVGFALDPDADRLVTASPRRGAVNEEYTLPLAFLGLRTKIRGPQAIVVNLSTSTLIDAVAKPAGARILRAPVGEANVVELMRKAKAVFGGEGNGGVIHPLIPSYGRDSLAGAALILSAMAARNAATLDELLDPMPLLHMEKTKVDLAGLSVPAVKERLRAKFKDAVADERDGLHLSWKDGSWVHARASNTEPILRIIAQAGSPTLLADLIKTAKGVLTSG